MSPLEEATTAELMDELERRYKYVLLVATKATKNDDDFDDTEVYYTGGLIPAIGLSVRARSFFNAKANASALGDEDNEDDE